MATLTGYTDVHVEERLASMSSHGRRAMDTAHRQFMNRFLDDETEDCRYEDAYKAATAPRECIVVAEHAPVSYPAAPFVPDYRLESADIAVSVNPRGPNALPAFS